MSLFCLSGVSGSSPLTRGKPGPVELSTKKTRLIPAHAGKTRSRRAQHEKDAAHPRSRGENTAADAEELQAWGSSPLTRGKLRHHRDRCRRDRLIPAHAGKTSQSPKPRPHLPAHPRSRGENHHTGNRDFFRLGSSPLTRGKPRRRALGGCGPPAHPRSRGENGAVNIHRHGREGSSPLTRGKPCRRRTDDA